MMELAKKTDTATGSPTAKTSVVDETGKMLSSLDAENYTEMMWDIVGTAFTHSNRNSSTIGLDESLLDFFGRELVTRIPEHSPDYEKRRKTMSQVAESWGAYVGNHGEQWLDSFSPCLRYCQEPGLLARNQVGCL